MNLKLFPNATKNNVEPMVGVSRKQKCISFNKPLCELVGLKKGDSLIVAEDTDTGNIYFANGKGVSGAHKLRGSGGVCATIRTSYVSVVENICDKIGSDSCKLYISAKPVEVDGRKWWRIVTSKPAKAK